MIQQEARAVISYFNPTEGQRLSQYAHILDMADQLETRLDNGEKLVCKNPQEATVVNGVEKIVFPITKGYPTALRTIAFNMYEGNFKSDPRLKMAVDSIHNTVRIKREMQKTQVDRQLSQMWGE